MAGRKKVPGPSLFDDTHCLLKLLGNLSLLLLSPLISFSSLARKQILTDVKRLKSGKKKSKRLSSSRERACSCRPAATISKWDKSEHTTPQESHRFHRRGISLLEQEVWEVKYRVSGCPRGKKNIHLPSCLITNSHPQNNRRKSIHSWVGWEQKTTSNFSIGTFYLDR